MYLIVCILFSIIMLFQIISIHPYEGSYFNEPLRFFIDKDIEQNFEIEFWGVSYNEGVNWINNNVPQNSKVCVLVANHLIKFYDTRKDIIFDCGSNVDYVMFFSRFSFLPNLDFLKPYSPVFKVTRYESNLLYVYKMHQ